MGCLFDASSGELLWEDKLNAPKCLFLDKRYLSPGGIYEAATGKRIGESGMQVQGGGCGMVTWVPALDGGLAHVSMGVKSPCGVGAYAAGGILSFAPSQCDCWPHQRGAAGFAPGAKLFSQVKDKPKHPLVRGAGFQPADTVNGQVENLPHDWPEYRGGLRRTGYSKIKAGKTSRVQWVSKLEEPLKVPTGHDMHRDQWLDRPTPPVTAGELAFYGSSDGSVRAVRIENGENAWTFWTGGAVLTSPVVSNGRLFIGSGDGWVYCLDASSGELLWKWRGAPADHRVLSCMAN